MYLNLYLHTYPSEDFFKFLKVNTGKLKCLNILSFCADIKFLLSVYYIKPFVLVHFLLL
jgi:hypothetical protein